MAEPSTSSNYSAQPGLFANGGGSGSSANYQQTGALVGLWFNQVSSNSANYQSGNPENGACGSDNGLTLTATPTNLCVTGAASGVTPGNTSYAWSCNGSNGGSTASCSATRNYVVTSSVSGGNGTVSASQNVAYNAIPSFTLTPDAGYVAGPVSGTCGGNLSGNSYTTDAVTASCTVVASFTAAPAVQTVYSGSTATNTGTATASVSGGGASCGFTAAQFVLPSVSVPAGVAFPHGLFDFTLDNCSSSVTLSVTYPSAVPSGTQYWKYGPTPGGGLNSTPHWYTIPASISGDTITFSINDGGLGDDDLAANGTIVDQGGPGVQAAQATPVAIPTLSEWGMILLVGMLGLLGMGCKRNGRVRTS